MSNPTYPPEEFLEQLQNAPYEDFHAIMASIKPHWEFSEWGWKQDGDIYYLSTGGWSGNEEIISALQQNTMFWLMYWMRESRGGHYIFAPINIAVVNKLTEQGETISVGSNPSESAPSLAYKALCIIEWIALHEEHEKEYVWFIYEAAHVALGRCKADHQDWIEKVEALYNKLQQTGRL
jgi:hypothetical protein